MKITVNTNQLLLALTRVSRAVPSSSSNASLTGVLVEAYDNKVFLRGTNQEITISTYFELDENLTEVGSFLVSGKLFLEIVKKLSSRVVDLEIDENEVIIKSNRSKFTLKQLSKEQFPKMPIRTWDLETELNILDLNNLIKKTSFAASTSPARAILQGVHFKTKNKQIIATATDSFRVGKFGVNIEDEKEINVVVPSSSLNELIKILNDGVVKVAFNKTHILFSFRDTHFESRLIEGIYPEVDKLFPTSFNTELVVNRQELIQAVERSSIMSTETSSNVVKIEYENNELKLSSRENEVGSAIEIIGTKFGAGSILTACSTKYLLDSLKAFESEEIKIEFTEEIRPFVITSDKETNHIQLLLPVRL